MVHWNNSYEYGKVQEDKVYPVIKEYFDADTITQSKGQYAKYDYIGDGVNYELKSRTNKYDAYPTTMITCNKLQSLTDTRLILLFNFTDKLCYIDFNVERFSEYTTAQFSRAGCCWDEKNHIYIPIEHLTVIKEWP